jgi:hypothetical protein
MYVFEGVGQNILNKNPTQPSQDQALESQGPMGFQWAEDEKMARDSLKLSPRGG